MLGTRTLERQVRSRGLASARKPPPTGSIPAGVLPSPVPGCQRGSRSVRANPLPGPCLRATAGDSSSGGFSCPGVRRGGFRLRRPRSGQARGAARRLRSGRAAMPSTSLGTRRRRCAGTARPDSRFAAVATRIQQNATRYGPSSPPIAAASPSASAILRLWSRIVWPRSSRRFEISVRVRMRRRSSRRPTSTIRPGLDGPRRQLERAPESRSLGRAGARAPGRAGGRHRRCPLALTARNRRRAAARARHRGRSTPRAPRRRRRCARSR